MFLSVFHERKKHPHTQSQTENKDRISASGMFINIHRRGSLSPKVNKIFLLEEKIQNAVRQLRHHLVAYKFIYDNKILPSLK